MAEPEMVESERAESEVFERDWMRELVFWNNR